MRTPNAKTVSKGRAIEAIVGRLGPFLNDARRERLRVELAKLTEDTLFHMEQAIWDHASSLANRYVEEERKAARVR